MKLFAILACLVINCAALDSKSFKCYTCANCRDGDEFSIVECRDVPGGNKTESCVRTVTKMNGETVVNRHCDVHGEECADIAPDSCTTIESAVTVCCCEEELCNGADAIHSVAMATVATIFTSFCLRNGI